MSDCLSHDVDYIRWVLGKEVENVFAVGISSDEELRENKVVDNATVVLTFASGE